MAPSDNRSSQTDFRSRIECASELANGTVTNWIEPDLRVASRHAKQCESTKIRMTRCAGVRAKSGGHSEVAVRLKGVGRQERMASVAAQRPSKRGNSLHRSECFHWMFHLVQRAIRRLEQSFICCAILR